MGRKVNQSTLDAYELIGKPRDSGGVHTAYSASRLVGANQRAVYKWADKEKKINQASCENEVVSGESQ